MPCLAILQQLITNQEVDPAVASSALQLVLTVHHRLCEQQAVEDSSIWPVLGHRVLILLSESCSSEVLSETVGCETLNALPALFRQGAGGPLTVSAREWVAVLKTALFPTLHQLLASCAAGPRLVAGLNCFERTLLMCLPILAHESDFEAVWRAALVVLAGFTRLKHPLNEEVQLVLQQLLAVLGELLGSGICETDLWNTTVEVVLALFELDLSEVLLGKMLGLRGEALPTNEESGDVGQVAAAGAEGEQDAQRADGKLLDDTDAEKEQGLSEREEVAQEPRERVDFI